MNLVEARQNRGLNRIGLAVASDVDVCRIAAHENGTLQLNAAEKEKLSIFFNMKINSREGEKIMATETPMEMPRMNMGEKINPIEAVRNHLETKHGKIKAAEKFKAMSASDLILLADDIASGKGSESETNEMPTMHITSNIRN